MFANRWFVAFLPLVLFWLGAWLRLRHRVVTWVFGALLLIFSVGVSLVGATDPLPRGGYDRYTAREAMEHWMAPNKVRRVSPLVANGN